MKTSTAHSKHSRPVPARFGKIAAAAAFGLLVGAFAVGSVRADERHGHHDRGHEERYEHHHGGDWERGPAYVYNEPDYYYAPAPDYYEAPEPYEYYDYPPGYYQPGPEYYPPAPSDGITLFFGR